MSRRKVTVYSTGERETLADSPFAALGGGRIAEARDEKVEATPAKLEMSKPYRVPRTRKGGWPLRVEKRSGGKSATIIGTVEGDAEALLRELKKYCSAGGVAKDGGVEIQGDQQARIAQWLDEKYAKKA